MNTSIALDIANDEMTALLAYLRSNPWPDGVEPARCKYDEMGPPIPVDVMVEPLSGTGWRGQMLTPPDVLGKRLFLFLHGGGYVFGSLRSHGGMVAEIARAGRCEALQLDYRRAPEHPYPAAVDDACAAYRWLLEIGYAPSAIALIGDSAGGGLVMATLVALKAAGVALPSAAVCISPWVDMEATGESYSTRAAMDPLVQREVVDLVTHLYLNGQDPRSPTASPIHADLTGLPPLLIQVGEREILYSDAEMLARKAQASGLDVVFESWAGMIHVWHLHYLRLSKGREAIQRIGSFLLEKMPVA